MDLFDSRPNSIKNLLPFDGEVYHIDAFFPISKSAIYFTNLLEKVPWKSDEIQMFGKKIITSRKVAWYADPGLDYTYSKTTKNALAWIPELQEIKEQIEKETQSHFNGCLLNLYHHGEEGMGWHSDNEKELDPNGNIASVSFGAPRKFSFKHKKTKDKVDVVLNDGSLLIMKAPTQEYWVHALPKTKRSKSMRINLTFRKLIS